MTRTVACLSALLFAATTLAASPDDPPFTMDEFYKNEARMRDMRLIGVLLLSLQHPQVVDDHQVQLARNWWAFQDDVELSEDERGLAKANFDEVFNRLVDRMQAYRPDELKFVGIDIVCNIECQDWYYAAFTPRGPLLTKVSVQFHNGVRVFDIAVYDAWDEIKAVWASTQIKSGDKVIGVTYTPPKKDEEPDAEEAV